MMDLFLRGSGRAQLTRCHGQVACEIQLQVRSICCLLLRHHEVLSLRLVLILPARLWFLVFPYGPPYHEGQGA